MLFEASIQSSLYRFRCGFSVASIRLLLWYRFWFSFKLTLIVVLSSSTYAHSISTEMNWPYPNSVVVWILMYYFGLPGVSISSVGGARETCCLFLKCFLFSCDLASDTRHHCLFFHDAGLAEKCDPDLGSRKYTSCTSTVHINITYFGQIGCALRMNWNYYQMEIILMFYFQVFSD